MMGYQSRQMAMIFVDMESLIPENHLLRKIDRMVSFDFIYDLLAPYYPATGRPSIDPASMFKMLLIGYLYGIKSERRLVEEVRTQKFFGLQKYLRRRTKGYTIKQPNMDCQPTEITAQMRHRAVFS